MTGAIQKRYVPKLIFVAGEKQGDTNRMQKEMQAYLWLLKGRYSFSDKNISLREIAVSECLYMIKNEDEFLEMMHNVSRNVATHLLKLFSGTYETDLGNDVIASAENVVDNGVDASIGDHLLVTHIATQLRQNTLSS